MESQEYVIKGTIEGIIKILEKDFQTPSDEAKFFVYALINQHCAENMDLAGIDNLTLWFLGTEEKCEGQIFAKHFTINFTEIKKNMYHVAYVFLVSYMFSRGIDLILIGADLLYLIVSNISAIDNTDFCVYSRILELCLGNKERLFSMNDIVTANSNGQCDYQNNDYECIHRGQRESCMCNNEKIQISIDHLKEKKIIKKVGERWMLCSN